MLKLRTAHFAAMAVLAAASTAHAAEGKRALPPEVDGEIACIPVTEPTARLACMDKAAAALQAAAGSGSLVILERKQVEAAQRQNFGLGHAEAAGTPPPPDQATFDVVAAAEGPDHHWILVLKEGGRWRLTDDQLLGREPKAGSKVRIRKTALGGYSMEIDGQPSLKASRIN